MRLLGHHFCYYLCSYRPAPRHTASHPTIIPICVIIMLYPFLILLCICNVWCDSKVVTVRRLWPRVSVVQSSSHASRLCSAFACFLAERRCGTRIWAPWDQYPFPPSCHFYCFYFSILWLFWLRDLLAHCQQYLCGLWISTSFPFVQSASIASTIFIKIN